MRLNIPKWQPRTPLQNLKGPVLRNITMNVNLLIFKGFICITIYIEGYGFLGLLTFGRIRKFGMLWGQSHSRVAPGLLEGLESK